MIKKYDGCRWYVLLPVTLCVGIVGTWFGSWMWVQYFSTQGFLVLWCTIFIIPGVFLFFITKKLAGFRKTLVASVTVLLYAIWVTLFVCGLANIAY